MIFDYGAVPKIFTESYFKDKDKFPSFPSFYNFDFTFFNKKAILTGKFLDPTQFAILRKDGTLSIIK